MYKKKFKEVMLSTVTEQQILNLKNSLEYEKESIVTKTVIKNKLTGYAFDRGQSMLPYTVPIEETFRIIEGRAEVMRGGKNFDLEEGEIIVMPKNVPHALFAKTKLKIALFKGRG